MRSDTEGLVDILFTLRAFLRGVMRCYGNHLSTSTFSLVFQVRAEHPPGCIGYSGSQTVVAYHIGRSQIFYDDGLIAVYVATGRFMQRVFALVGNALVDTSNQPLRLFASVASLLALCQCALCSCQFLGTLFRVPGIFNDPPVTIGNEVTDAHIQPDRVVLLGKRFRAGFTDALHVPARRTQDDTSKFEGAGEWAMHDHTDATPTDSRSFEAPVVQAVGSITKLDGIPGVRILEARKTHLATFFDATEEVGKGAVKTFEGRINHHGGQVGMRLFAVVFVLLVDVQVLACLLIVSNQLPLAIMSVLSPVGTIVTGAKKKKIVQQKNRAAKRAFKTVLAQIREQLQKYADEQRQIALLSNPAPEMLEARIKERSRLWERRPADPDFLAARVGTGRTPSTVTITNVPTNPIDVAGEEARALARDFTIINDIPCTIAISKVKSLGISGARQNVAAFTRSLLCQLACEHSPEDVRFLAILPASQQHDWDWLNDLPHTEPLRGCKLSRLTSIGEDEADKLLSFLLEELSQRASRQAELAASGTNTPSQSVAQPHLVVVIHDYMDVYKHPALTNAFKLGEELGVSIIYLVAQEQAIHSTYRRHGHRPERQAYRARTGRPQERTAPP
jgi:hypothetical protein